MKQLDLVGKSPEDVRKLLAKAPRQTLLECIARLAAMEPHFSVTEFAQARRLTRETVLQLIRDKKLAPVNVPTDRGDYRIPLSTVRNFDQRTAIGST